MSPSMTAMVDEYTKIAKPDMKEFGKGLAAYSAGAGVGTALGFGVDQLIKKYGPLMGSGKKKAVAAGAGMAASILTGMALNKVLKASDGSRKRNS